MNNADIEEIKQKLVALKSQLEELAESSKSASEPIELDQARIGRLSRMDAMQAQQMSVATAQRRQEQLLKIEGALHRIESGEYGYCFVCGNEIDIRRLEIDPSNTRCMKCAEK